MLSAPGAGGVGGVGGTGGLYPGQVPGGIISSKRPKHNSAVAITYMAFVLTSTGSH